MKGHSDTCGTTLPVVLKNIKPLGSTTWKTGQNYTATFTFTKVKVRRSRNTYYVLRYYYYLLHSIAELLIIQTSITTFFSFVLILQTTKISTDHKVNWSSSYYTHLTQGLKIRVCIKVFSPKHLNFFFSPLYFFKSLPRYQQC